MITIQENIPLLSLNTFHIRAMARYYCEVSNADQLQELLDHPLYKDHAHLILGGGSNILFTKDFDGIVVKSAIMGRAVIEETDDFVVLTAGAGENWHSLVLYCIAQGWGGIENLSLIPGTVGAAPIQNIGAYGVEIKSVIDKVSTIDLTSGARRIFYNSDCQFGYRESVFKEALNKNIFISSITLRLTKRNHILHTHYGALQEVLNQRAVVDPTIKDISDAVISIRQSKLPDPTVTGNAGSFFKNPTIHQDAFNKLKEGYPLIPSYPSDNQNVKIPAGWLIEQCGWKGKRFGNVGVHPLQALVLVNYGGGNGEEILQLSMNIQSSVKEKFGVNLSTEVNIF